MTSDYTKNECMSFILSFKQKSRDWSSLITLYMVAIYILTHTVHYHHGWLVIKKESSVFCDFEDVPLVEFM